MKIKAMTYNKTCKLFDGSLGVYPYQNVHIDHLLSLELLHHWVYTVPDAYEQTLKKELYQMNELGILEVSSASEWALSCFVIAKKDG